MLLHFKRPGESKVFGGALIKLGWPGHKPWQFSTMPVQLRVVMTVSKRKVLLHASTFVNKISRLIALSVVWCQTC